MPYSPIFVLVTTQSAPNAVNSELGFPALVIRRYPYPIPATTTSINFTVDFFSLPFSLL
jgi:hypothetical protein